MIRTALHNLMLTGASLCLSGGLILTAQSPGQSGEPMQHQQTTPGQQPGMSPNGTANPNGPQSPGENPGAADTTQSAGAQKVNDKNFVKKAAEGGMEEVAIGNLAAQKGTTPAVRQFGQKLVADHTKGNEQLKQVAAQQNLVIPSSLSGKQQRQVNKLAKLSGPKFDKAFAKHEVKDHRKDINEFQREAQDGSNPAVKQFASNTLPVLEQHLNEAKSLNSSGETSTGQANNGQ